MSEEKCPPTYNPDQREAEELLERMAGYQRDVALLTARWEDDYTALRALLRVLGGSVSPPPPPVADTQARPKRTRARRRKAPMRTLTLVEGFGPFTSATSGDSATIPDSKG
jgi:hypothetical protein